MVLRSKTFIRYVFSYALILFLPLLFLCLVFYSVLMDRYTEEITQSNSRVLTQVQERFDEQLEQMILLSYLIQNNASLHPSAIGEDIVAARSAVNTLNIYKGMTTLPELILVAAEDSESLYTNTGVLSKERFFTQQYVYGNHTADDFAAALAHPSGIVTWGSDTMKQFGGQSGEYITLFVAVQRGNLSPKMRSVYIIPVKRLQKAIASVASEYDGHVYIFDQYGEIIMTDQTAPLPDAAKKVQTAQAEGQHRFHGDEGEYFLSSTRSKIAGWQYVVSIPAAAIEAPLHHVLMKMAMALVAICLLGGVAVYWFSLRQYRPLHRLREQALAYGPVGQGTEVEQVSAAMRRLSQDSEAYRSRLENGREALLQHCLTRLLYGLSDAHSLLRRAGEEGLDLASMAPWVVVTIDFSRPMDAGYIAQVRSALLSESFSFTQAILCENPPDGHLLALLVPCSAGEDDWEMRLYPLQAYLREKLSGDVAFGVSSPVAADALDEGYRQAAAALGSKLLLGSSCIAVYSDEQEGSGRQMRYPLQALESLQWHLLQLDAESTTDCIHHIMEEITNSAPPFHVARMICFDVLSVTLHSLYSMTDHESVRPTDSMLEQLAGFDTIEELTALLDEVIRTACESIRQMRSSDGDERVQWIRKYVTENCFDPDFSIYTTAEYFSLTPSNLSHYFKNLTGESISDYVQALRRAEACRLLTQTDLSVQEIGQRVGMLNVSSFIRSFKQQTGMTPGQYRSVYAKEARRSE